MEEAVKRHEKRYVDRSYKSRTTKSTDSSLQKIIDTFRGKKGNKSKYITGIGILGAFNVFALYVIFTRESLDPQLPTGSKFKS